jgi:glucose/arabinose dehydrogenase
MRLGLQNSRRLRLFIVGAIIVAVVGALVVSAVAARVRARSRADWFEGKNLTLAPAVKGLKEPTFVAGPPDNTKRLFVLEREGRVRVVSADGQLRQTPFLDLTQVTASHQEGAEEEGLLGLAFHPQFARNGYVYVDYTANDKSVNVIRYTVAPDRPDQVDPATAQTVLAIPKKSAYHNGGTLAFGRDGYLYISIGDNEESESAQDLSSIFGKILRIDVDSAQPYAIPASNPFASRSGARGEIWTYGFRNPWRFSFDRATADMWIGDVGDSIAEEIDFQASDSHGGENYGWPTYEGSQCVDTKPCQQGGVVMPLVTYSHDMNCAVMGGYVYRGPTAPHLAGVYLFGDLCTGGVFSMRRAADQSWQRVELGFQPIKIDSFGEDPAGDVYVVDQQGGVVYRIMDGAIPSGT